jgi:hypothetical protein
MKKPNIISHAVSQENGSSCRVGQQSYNQKSYTFFLTRVSYSTPQCVNNTMYNLVTLLKNKYK